MSASLGGTDCLLKGKDTKLFRFLCVDTESRIPYMDSSLSQSADFMRGCSNTTANTRRWANDIVHSQMVPALAG
jgi:hypothetical protein